MASYSGVGLTLHLFQHKHVIYILVTWRRILRGWNKGTQTWHMRGDPKIMRIFFWRERGGTSICSRLVRVCDCPRHQLAKRRPWGKLYRIRVIFFLSLCHCFHRFFVGRLKRTTCLHQVLFPFGENSSRNCYNASRGF